MRIPSFFTAAVAGLWQRPFLPKETITSTRHVRITRNVTAIQSTVYAMRVGTSTSIMVYVPASIKAKASSQAEMQSSAPSVLNTPPTAAFLECTSASVHCGDLPEYPDPSGHLEIRSADDTTSTRHVQVTLTVQSVEATVYATSVGSSVSTLTSIPASLVVEVSAEAEAMDHSTVGALVTETPEAGTKTSIQSRPDTTNATSLNIAGMAQVATTDTGASQVSVVTYVPTTTQARLASVASTDITIPIGLELRSDSDETSTSHIKITKTIAETQSTIYEMQLSSTTSSTASVPSTIIAIASSETSAASSTVAVDAASATENTETDVKSTQTAFLENQVKSSSQDSTTYQTTVTTISSSLSSSSTISTRPSTSSIETRTSTESTGSTISSDNILTTLTTAWKPNTSTSAITSEASSSTATSVSASSKAASTAGTSYASEASSASVTADNAAGASGSDNSSFKLSSGGFVAIISVVSIGVGLGILFLILFVIAKRRQWRVRASISRASRRLTNRFNPTKPSTTNPNEKPTLPTIQPHSAIPGPGRPEIKNARAAGVGADRTPYRNGTVRTPGAATRFSVRTGGGVREGNGMQGSLASGALGARDGRTEGRGSAERKKPELRVDTRLAREMEEGGVRE